MTEQHISVKTHIAQNVLGGFGVATVAGVAAVFVFGAPLLVVGPYALAAGAIVFGLFSITRAFGDEVTWLVRVAAEKYADRRNAMEVTQLRNQNEILKHQIAQLENGDAVDDQAPQVAYQILHDYFNRGLSMSYEACYARKACTRPTWDWLHSLLVAAKVKDSSGKVLVKDFNEAWQKFGEVYAESNRKIRTSGGKFIPAAPRHLLTRN